MARVPIEEVDERFTIPRGDLASAAQRSLPAIESGQRSVEL
jgi:hypothetical protein